MYYNNGLCRRACCSDCSSDGSDCSSDATGPTCYERGDIYMEGGFDVTSALLAELGVEPSAFAPDVTRVVLEAVEQVRARMACARLVAYLLLGPV